MISPTTSIDHPRAFTPPTATAPIRHAGLGITSHVLAIFNLVNIVLMASVKMAAGSTFQQRDILDTDFSYVLGGWTLAIGLISICGIIFGIGGLRQRNRRHSLAITGLFLNIAIPTVAMFAMLLDGGRHVPPPKDPATIAFLSPDSGGAWNTPVALTFGSLTVILGIAVLWLRMRRRRAMIQSASGQMHELTVCGKCRKVIPNSSQFCRRCGNILGPAPTA